MNRRCGRRPGHPHKTQYLEIEFLHGSVDTNRGMSVVGNGDAEINRRVLEPRARHREDDLLVMHRERRALSDYRRTQEVELYVALSQRQFALGCQAPRSAGIAVDNNLAANRSGHTEVGRIEQQRQTQLRWEVVKSESQVVHV